MPRLIYSANYLTEANKTNIVPQVVGMVEISSGGFAPGTITAHATFPLPSPYNYDGRLRDVSSIDCSLNGAYGRVSFAITNADLGEVSNVAADKYVGWECKVHKIIILEDGTLLGILLLHGVITSYTMTDRVVDMDVVTRINVGNTITPRRVNVKCPWVFKGTECGYSGVETTCNKLYNDADGCSGRSNQHRFGGFPLRLPEASIGAVSGQGGAPTYQLIRDDSAFQLQRAILEFDNTFSVTDDPTNNKTVISVTGGGGGGSGTVTSVALTVPSFLSVTGSPITTSGTLAVTLATQNANTVFAGPTTGSAAAPTFRALVAGDIPDLSSIYQPLDADLTAIAALTGDGLLRKTGGTWAMDSASYLTANQTITLSGDVTGSGATSIATTIANAAVTFAKMQSIATGRLLGRTTASTGPIEEITPGANVLTWLQTPSSANLAAAVTDETGSGALVFATSPTLVTPNIGVATGTSFNSITGLSSTTPSATVTTTAVVGTSTAAARADHVHSIADDAVTYAKMQDVSAASRLLGRGSAGGSGDVEEITVGGGIEFTSGAGIQTTALTGDVTKSAGGTSTTIANDAVTTAKILDAAVTPAKLSSVAQVLAFKNRIINGSMMVAQRGTSFTSTGGANNNDVYTLDRWTILSDGNDTIDVTQATDVPTGGLFSIGLDVETINRKFGIIQFIEQRNCIGLIGNTVTLSFKARVTSTTKLDNVKCAILAWSGTADSLTSNVVSTWNVEGTNPTLVANWTYENTPANLNVTTSWATYSVSAAVDTANTKNVAVFIWSDVTDTSLGDFLYITDVQLERGPTATEFEVLPYSVILNQCLPYFLLWARHTSGTVTSITNGQAQGVNQVEGVIVFPVRMRANPTFFATAGSGYSFFQGGAPYNFSDLLGEQLTPSSALLYNLTVTAGSATGAGRIFILFGATTGMVVHFTAEL
jgi:hypothetical protein